MLRSVRNMKRIGGCCKTHREKMAAGPPLFARAVSGEHAATYSSAPAGALRAGAVAHSGTAKLTPTEERLMLAGSLK